MIGFAVKFFQGQGGLALGEKERGYLVLLDYLNQRLLLSKLALNNGLLLSKLSL